MLRIGIVAGEVSGDILGAGLIKELKALYPDAVFEGIGGPLMQAQGCRSLFSMDRLAVMGLIGPRRLCELLSIRRQLRHYYLSNPPQIFVGIDAPDFNLGLEKKLHAAGIKTVHYVSPSVWAWRRYRIRKIRKAVDMMLTLLPFEAAFYRGAGVPVTFVGHPMADHIPMHTDRDAARAALNLAPDAEIIALLPGSRMSEVKYLASAMLAAARWCLKKRPNLQFVAPFANAHTRQYFEQLQIQQYNELPITLVDGRSQLVIAAADVVILASGTATLETALLKRPMVVTYKMGAFGFWVYKSLVKVAFVALPNLLAGRALVPELLQDAATPEALGEAALEYLRDPTRKLATQQAFESMHMQLRCAADTTAAHAVAQLMGAT
ncbi:MAG: lipid-A-disaccharide synthase [Pseudomonadota bacterium]